MFAYFIRRPSEMLIGLLAILWVTSTALAEQQDGARYLRPSTVDQIIEQLNTYRSQQQQNVPKTEVFQLSCNYAKGLRCEFPTVKRALGKLLTERLASHLLVDLGIKGKAEIRCRRDKVGRRSCEINRGKGFTPLPVRQPRKR